MKMAAPLLEVSGLKVDFGTERGVVRALFGVSFSLEAGETLGLVGESGCGKTVTALSILRLLPSPPARVEEGRIGFRGRDLLALSEEDMCAVRGKEISMIFQEPMTSLNPVLTIGEQVAEVYTAHGPAEAEAAERAQEWLCRVKMPDPPRRMREYPHQMSGGMRQRAMIAMALALEPSLLIADEPTTALDVTIQAQILELLKDMREQERQMAILLITHDLGVVHEFADRVAIMYLGRIAEIAKTPDLFADPIHPYTQGLLRSLPGRTVGEKRLPSIPGTVPDLHSIPPGCPFADRCPFRQKALEQSRAGETPGDELSVCDRVDPPLEEYAPGHFAACHYQKKARRPGGRR
jgi:oligopeptide/dipeptide ABC transporter ATP-binding protein